jgi:hypothetical protein
MASSRVPLAALNHHRTDFAKGPTVSGVKPYGQRLTLMKRVIAVIAR